MRKMHLGWLFVVAWLLMGCNSGRLSPQALQQKLDSIARLESKERLEAQGIHLDRDVSPIQLFYDSLGIQPLPVRYTQDLSLIHI